MYSIPGPAIPANITHCSGSRGAARKRMSRLKPSNSALSSFATALTTRYRIEHTSVSIRQDHVRGFFTDHVNGADDKETGNARKHRGIDHSQSVGAVHLKIARQHAAFVFGTNRTGAGS